MKKLEGPIIVFVLVAAVTMVLATQEKEHGGRLVSAILTGAAEVPPGDADGAGTFNATLNPGQNQICYELTVSNIGAAIAAHIHLGAVDKAGPVVVTLKTPGTEVIKECVMVDREKIQAIIKDPGDYYVNVHNAEFPDGAVRGQLSK